MTKKVSFDNHKSHKIEFKQHLSQSPALYFSQEAPTQFSNIFQAVFP